MSEVRIFRVPNRLRDKILKSGGPRAMEILAKAEANLAEMRPPCLDVIDELIGEIVRHYGRAARKGDEDFQGLYVLSSRIIDVAAPVAEMEIDRVAFFLCELVDRCSGQEKWDWPSVDVHIDALHLLRHGGPNLPEAARAQVFAGLQRINQRLPSLATSEAAKDEPDPAMGGEGGAV